MAYEGLINNKNAEQWTHEEAERLYDDAIALSINDEYDFIGEVARDLGTYRHIFDYLNEKFPDLKHKHEIILCNLEANCFCHSKKGTIKEATAIVNLKSNYKWKDRVQQDGDINLTAQIVFKEEKTYEAEQKTD